MARVPGRGRFEFDNGLRLLLGKPQDRLVPGVGIVGQRILLVSRKGLHLRRGRAGEFAASTSFPCRNRLIAR